MPSAVVARCMTAQSLATTERMNMTRRITSFLAALGLGGIAVAMPLFAQETKPSPETRPSETRPSEGTMSDHRGMMNMMGRMSPEQMSQMVRMMENCNRMMEGMGNAPAGGSKEGTPTKP